MLSELICDCARHGRPKTRNGRYESSSILLAYSESTAAHGMPLGLNTSRVLGKESLDDIFSITKEASSDWKRIGLGLRLSTDTIRDIERTPVLIVEGPTGYYQEVLRQWLLKDDPKPTVGELAAALNKVGRETEALELPDKVAEKLGRFPHLV